MIAAPAAIATTPAPTETIILLRHGEKPPGGLGQLSCQGLNRALALPAIIQRDFGKPDAIFAPNPADTKIDSGKTYDYIRPLATIEPTAIAFGLPVNVGIGVDDWGTLARLLDTDAYAHALVLVAWEHTDIVKLIKAIITAHAGNATQIPNWNHNDFDSIYVVRITRGASPKVRVEHQQEGLNNQPEQCPKPAN